MAQQHLLLAIVLVAYIFHVASSSATTSANITEDSTGTVYDVLQQKNLPRGLLPIGVKSYSLHAGGALEVTLPSECNFFVTVDGKKFQFRYGSSINGIITPGSITRISGVRVQVEFAFLAFNQVSRAGDQLNIQLEKSTQSFPVSAFAQSPSCN
uniref:Uncharacterized protein n=1 Tax=Leersia perrieri TaxID=77586 RepID=A0A0D9VG45_9ORYZ